MPREWERAWEKAREGCRVCGDKGQLVAPAHLWPRARGGTEDPNNIVGLCQKHHTLFDSSRFDLMPYLTADEQAEVVRQAGSIELARQRLTGER